MLRINVFPFWCLLIVLLMILSSHTYAQDVFIAGRGGGVGAGTGFYVNRGTTAFTLNLGVAPSQRFLLELTVARADSEDRTRQWSVHVPTEYLDSEVYYESLSATYFLVRSGPGKIRVVSSATASVASASFTDAEGTGTCIAGELALGYDILVSSSVRVSPMVGFGYIKDIEDLEYGSIVYHLTTSVSFLGVNKSGLVITPEFMADQEDNQFMGVSLTWVATFN